MKKHILLIIPGLIALLLSSFFISAPSIGADDSICARVKIEIGQELTLERQAFDAHMAINNGLSNITLENVQVDVNFSDQDGNAVLASTDPNNTNALFFIRIDSLKNITNITGSGTVLPSTTADIHWLIIPAPGSSNGLELGTLYYLGATLRYTIGGQQNVTTVSPDYIFVKPMPQLALDYFIPSDVYGDDPFTPGVKEPTVPFSLGVRARNTGAGIAKNLKIDSAQPKIVDNDQGLLIGFNIEGTEVNGKTAVNSLLADFGDILPQASGVARWIMTSSLSGKFVQFDAQYSHSDELGGQMTSLMTDPITHFLVRDVLLDLPGRDGNRDFLAKDGAAYRLYESECLDSACNDSDVADQSTSSSLSLLSQNGTEATYRLSVPVTAGSMFARLADPFGGQKVIKEVIRSDSKQIKTDNTWLSQTRYRGDPWEYFFNLFDVNTTNSYTVVFADSPSGPHAPVLQFIPDRTVSAGQQISFVVVASDPDGSIPLLSAAPLPALAQFIDQGNGLGTFNWTPTLAQAGVYSITYTASDGILKSTRRAAITVSTTGNHPPLVPSSPSPSNGAEKVPIGAGLSWVGGDPDQGDTVTYDVFMGTVNPPTTKVSSNQAGQTYKPTTMVFGTTYFWKIVARDSFGAETSGPIWRFSAGLSEPPIAEAGPNQNMFQGHVVRLDGSGSQSPAQLPITYLWSFTELPAGSAAALSNTRAITPEFTPDLPGVYRIRLVVNDGMQNSVPDEVVITVFGLPVADAGPDRNAVSGQTYTLDGSASFDPAGNMISFQWTFAEVPAGSSLTDASLSGPTGAKPKFTPDSAGSYRLRLVVNEGSRVSGPDEVVITASTSTAAPNAEAGPNRNVLTGTMVQLDGSASYDPDDVPQSLTYLWSLVTKPAESLLTNNDIADRNSSQTTFVADRDGLYELKLTVSDGILSSEDTVRFIAAGVGVSPNADAGPDMILNLGEPAVLNGSASNDPDNSPQPQTYQWAFVAKPIGSQLTNENISGANSASPSFQPDVAGTYVVRLSVSDGVETAFDNVAVTVRHYIIITPTAGAGGTITPASAVNMNYGTSQTFAITPEAGYHVVDVLVDGASIGAATSYTFSGVTTNHTVEASFAVNQYSITASAGAGGGVAPSGSTILNYGASQILSITPEAGYHVADVRVDGVSVGAVTSYTFGSVTTNHTIEASFDLNQFTIIASADPNGIIAPSGTVTLNFGTSQTFTVTPSAGYHVVDVLVDGSSVGALTPYTFDNVTGNHTIEASFAINQYPITVSAGANGSIAPAGAVTMNHGTTQTFTITPGAGYHIANVWVDGTSVGAVKGYTFTKLTTAHTIQAVFGTGLYSLDIPRTGQTEIYALGDDGTYQAGIRWPSPRFTLNPDTSVTDNLTTLVWAPDGGMPPFGSCTGGLKTWLEALDYIACLNAHNYLDYNQWRLPTLNEMESLTHAGLPDSSIWLASQGFPNAAPAFYWSSTSLSSQTDQAWAVNLQTGDADHGTKDYTSYVLPVSGAANQAVWATGQMNSYTQGDDGDFRSGIALPDPRMVINPDSTLTDNLTGLSWTQDGGVPSYGPCTGGQKTWQGALNYIACLNTNNYLGHNDWRLPNRKELRSLIDYGQENAALWLLAQGFFNVTQGGYWSSTTLASSSDMAWFVNMASGKISANHKAAQGFLWPVRTGIIAPMPTVSGGGPYTMDEGGQITVMAVGTDPEGRPLSYHWDLNNDWVFETPGQSVILSVPEDDGPSSRWISVLVTDIEGRAAIDQIFVAVNNVDPVITGINAPLDPVAVNSTVNLTADFIDLGTPDTHTAIWDWGDGTFSAGTVNEAGGAGIITAAHTYRTAGVYTIGLSLTDDDGGNALKKFYYLVVYNPEAGFVTGGGWINSPAGAYALDPALTGKANFGFIAKYHHGATIPSGQTEFNFKLADLHFQSTVYEWLVVAGPHAKYKGSGTINNGGAYGFMLTSTDGQINGGGGVDKFRLKIWDKMTGEVIYDNQPRERNDADASNAIEGGSIVIHSN